jgi:aryl-alcohol dehydrogenase-like predicted oxidoreductase
MRRRPLGKTGLEVTELALGTWSLSGDGYGPAEPIEQDRVIDRAHALGIRLFETADVYAQGTMETKLGERLPRDDSTVIIVTKIGTDRQSSPGRKRFDRDYLRQAVDASRKRLDRDRLDVVLLHNPAAVTLERGEATETMQTLAQQGVLQAWGVSAGSADIARAAIAQGAQVLSMAYNVFLSTDLHDLHEDIVRSGVGLLARSVLAHGLLCGYWSMHKQFPRGDHRTERWTPDELRRRVNQVQALRPLVGGQIYTLRSGALRYALANEDVSAVILGPRNAVQLDQLVREAGQGPPYVPEDRLTRLAARLEDFGIPT